MGRPPLPSAFPPFPSSYGVFVDDDDGPAFPEHPYPSAPPAAHRRGGLRAAFPAVVAFAAAVAVAAPPVAAVTLPPRVWARDAGFPVAYVPIPRRRLCRRPAARPLIYCLVQAV